MQPFLILASLSAIILCGSFFIADGDFAPDNCPLRAVVVLKEDGVGAKCYGYVEFCQSYQSYEPVFMQLNIYGLSPGLHGMHVHEKGDLRQGCNSTGGHFNPFNNKHGDRNAQFRHLGDLGNIVADGSGRAVYQLDDRLISLHGDYSILGRALVIHEKEDDLGLGGNLESLKTGNAGRRVACGIIGKL
ncbi:unnamed protein product [Bemisia tabaci]|uniref:Superoxide dismutase [Cu-Zn] n=1 Tax=Bemisia tabaci TaxID=7038 RepID=A0A7S5HGF6_BEMTA|nr:superoxide dismutase [Bemisia tabaci]CAH0394533.1 unnamed protein product [Bemisia tabaci]